MFVGVGVGVSLFHMFLGNKLVWLLHVFGICVCYTYTSGDLTLTHNFNCLLTVEETTP